MENGFVFESDMLKVASNIISRELSDKDSDFRKAFEVSVESVLKELPRESTVSEVVIKIVDRIAGCD